MSKWTNVGTVHEVFNRDINKLYHCEYCDVLLPGNMAQKRAILRHRELGGTQ